MPTGNTAPVQSGEVSDLRTFALRCAKAFCPSLRDDALDAPMPSRLEPDTSYYDEHMREAADREDDLAEMTNDAAAAAAEEAHAAAVAAWRARRERYSLERCRYEAMMDKVRAWQPPEACANLKSFMLSQLESSIEFDFPSEDYDPPPVRMAPAEWLEQERTKARTALLHYSIERDEVIRRTADKNRWLDALRASLVESKE